jgi:hypothetical protein
MKTLAHDGGISTTKPQTINNGLQIIIKYQYCAFKGKLVIFTHPHNLHLQCSHCIYNFIFIHMVMV